MKIKDPPFIQLFDFKLYNIEDFIHGDFRVINPVLQREEYFEYYEDILTKTMVGVWGKDYNKKTDQGGYRHCPGSLWFYRNLFWLRQESEDGRPGSLEHPMLRDVDWFIKYAFEEAEGFSGFEYDKKHTCHRFAKEHDSFKELMGYEKKMLERYADDILDKYGKFKIYVHPRTYMHSTFREPLGNPLYQNENQNLIWFASRRLGKSYHFISDMVRGFMLNNARTVDEYYTKNTKFVGIFGSYGESYTNEHYTKFFDSYDKLADVGAYDKDGIKENGAFWWPWSGTKESNKYFTNLTKEEGGKRDVGWGSQIHRFTFSESISAGVGVASDRFIGDEIGLWDDLEGVNSEMDPTQRKEVKFASSFYGGTGGQVVKALKTKNAFLNPERINAISFPDLCKPKATKEIGMFIPVQYTKKIYRNENGNIDLRSAYNDELRIRNKEKDKGIGTFLKHIAAYCMTYDDIFMLSSNSGFPVDRASEKLGKITTFPVRQRPTTKRIGNLIRTVNKKAEVVFVDVDSIDPIMNYEDVKKASAEQLEAALILVFEEPDYSGKSKYLTTYDPVKDLSGTSLCVATTYKVYGMAGTIRMNIVAECIYRRLRPDENDDVAINMAIYYKSLLAPETNVPNIVTYLETLGFYDILGAPCPIDALRTLLLVNEKYDIGVYISPQMRSKIPTVCNEVFTTIVGKYKTEEGDEREIWMVDEIESEYLLNDIISFNDKGNFDYISNFFIFALYIKQWSLEGTLYEEVKKGNDLFDQILKHFNQVIQEPETHSVFGY